MRRMSICLPFWAVISVCGSICTFLLLSALHCVGLTALREQADVLALCGTPGLCLSATKYVVTFPLHSVPSCLWRGLWAPLGITVERAAVCQPPPEPVDWAVVGVVPSTEDLAVIDIYNLKAISQMKFAFLIIL